MPCSAHSNLRRVLFVLIVPILVSTVSVTRAGNNLWTSGGPGGGEVSDVIIHPTIPDVAYAASNLGGVFKSVDGGVSWATVNEGIAFPSGSVPFVQGLFFRPGSPETVYAITSNRIFRTDNGGVNWSPTNLATSGKGVTAHPSAPDTLYAFGFGGVQKSTDGGANWAVFNNGLTSLFVEDLVIDPAAPDTLYAATGDGVFKSVNGGGIWASANSGRFESAQELAFDSADPAPGTIYALGVNRLHRSIDGGFSWTQIGTGLPNFGAAALTADPAIGGAVFVVTGDYRAFESTDFGDSWTERSSGHIPSFVNRLAIAPSDSDRMLMASTAGVYRSLDRAMNWNDASTGLGASSPRSIVTDPSNPDILYASASSSLYRSLDGGSSWQRANGDLPQAGGGQLDMDVNGKLYLSGTSLRTSTDGGVTWTPAGTGLPLANVNDIAIDPVFSNVLYAATGQGIYCSTDTATTWTICNTGISADRRPETVEIDPLDPTRQRLIALASRAGTIEVYRSTDGAQNWTRSENGLNGTPFRLAFDQVSSGGTQYAWLGTSNGVFRSDDGGASWSPQSGDLPLPIQAQLALTTSPTTPGTVFVANNTGIYRSENAGLNWVLLDDGVTEIGRSSDVVTLHVAANASDIVRAGVTGRGVQSWTFSGPGITVLPESLSLAEPSGTGSLLIRLDTSPAAPVSITVDSLDPDECTISPTIVVLDAETRFAEFEIAVVDDVLVDGTQTCRIETSAASSMDAAYDGRTLSDVTVEVADNDVAGLLVAPLILSVNEPDSSATFDISAQTPLLEAVQIPLLVSGDECDVFPSPVILDSAAPSSTVTVRAIDDLAIDGDQPCLIETANSISIDPAYNGLDAADVLATVEDNDAPGIAAVPQTLSVDEGAVASFEIALTAIPDADVTATFAASGGECALSAGSVSLTAVQLSMTVLVEGIPDSLLDGPQSCVIAFDPTTSSDTRFAGLALPDVVVTVNDATTPAVLVEPTAGLVTDEAGGTDSFTVALSAVPTENVTVTLSSSDPGEGLPSPTLLTFTPSDALQPQTITVTGQPDFVIDPAVAFTIITAPSQSDQAAFDQLDGPDVGVVNLDIDDIVLIDGFESNGAGTP